MLRRVAIGAALAGALIATVSAAAAGPADEADQQRAVLEDLQAGEEQALVDLFAADSALGRAEARAQKLEERLAGVRERVGETERSLEISQSNLLVARKLLSERIEQWYRMDEIDAIEIILGSDSLSDVIDQFDAIERMSSRDAEVVRGHARLRGRDEGAAALAARPGAAGGAAGDRRPRRGRSAGGRARVEGGAGRRTCADRRR